MVYKDVLNINILFTIKIKGFKKYLDPRRLHGNASTHILNTTIKARNTGAVLVKNKKIHGGGGGNNAGGKTEATW